MIAKKSSWLSGISFGLGVLSLAGVVCFYFPTLLTSQEFRKVYTEGFARRLLLIGIVFAFATGTIAILRNQGRKVAVTGVISAALAVLLGGITVKLNPIVQTPYSLGLDWFVISLFFSALIFIPIERMLAVKAMSPLRAEWRTDMVYFFVSHVIVQFVLITVTASTAAVAAFAAFPEVKAAIQSLPLWVQFLMAIFFADVFQAGLHRLYHKWGGLWRLHAVHHSSPAMDWLAGSRVHVVEMILTRAAVLLPLVVLGFSQAAVNAYVVLVGIQAVVAHANMRIDFGWLEYLIVTPRYHHWHHARHADYVDRNYAIHLPLVDMLMGTFKLPPRREWPEEYGVMEREYVPRGFGAQLKAPFVKQRPYEDFVGRADA